MKKREWLILFFLSLVGWSHCGGTKSKLGEPWRQEEAPFFDDGVDLVNDLSKLNGEWASRQKNWLEGRIQLADFVALVEIKSVQTNTDAGDKEVKRINVSVVESLYGVAPSAEIFLESQEDAPGHELVLRYERHLNGEFILFARWFKVKDQMAHHFHLSPASEVMLAGVRKRIKVRSAEEGRKVSDEDE